MKATVFIPAIFILFFLNLSLYGDESANNGIDRITENRAVIVGTTGDDNASRDIRDLTQEKPQEKPPEKTVSNTGDKEEKKLPVKKPLKKAEKNKTNKTENRPAKKTDKRGAVGDVTFGELIEGTYIVREYGRVTSDTRRSADDTTVPFRYRLLRDGSGTVDMDDPSLTDLKLRWHVEGNALIVEELDSRGYLSLRLRFLFLQTEGTVIFEKSDVQYGDVNATRREIVKLGR